LPRQLLRRGAGRRRRDGRLPRAARRYLHALPIKLRREGGADTVFHNKIAHLREIAAVIVENDVHVATMGLTTAAAYKVGTDGLIRTADGRLPAILHQYDRIPELKPAVEARYGLSPSLTPTSRCYRNRARRPAAPFPTDRNF